MQHFTILIFSDTKSLWNRHTRKRQGETVFGLTLAGYSSAIRSVSLWTTERISKFPFIASQNSYWFYFFLNNPNATLSTSNILCDMNVYCYLVLLCSFLFGFNLCVLVFSLLIRWTQPLSLDSSNFHFSGCFEEKNPLYQKHVWSLIPQSRHWVDQHTRMLEKACESIRAELDLSPSSWEGAKTLPSLASKMADMMLVWGVEWSWIYLMLIQTLDINSSIRDPPYMNLLLLFVCF